MYLYQKDIKYMEQLYSYTIKKFDFPTKRYCQTLDLKNDPELIAAYKKLHSEEHIWKETLDAIHAVGILEMEIYLCGNHLFMIIETPADFDWDCAMAKMAALPKQKEWEALTARYQQTDPNAASAEKWHLMERIFHLYK